MTQRFAWLAALLLLIGLGLPRLASAHSELVTSTPKDGAALDRAPAQISAVFSEEFDLAGSGLTVEDSSGQRVDQNDARLDPADASQKTMLVSLKSGLGAGSYTVRWKTLAADGDTAEGSFSFSVRAATSASPSPSAAASSPAAGATSGAAGGTAGSSGDTASTLPATGASTTGLGGIALLAVGLCCGGLLLRRSKLRV